VIGDILLSWNELTVTIVAWLAVVSLALTADFGPEIYREHKARHFMANVTIQAIAERRAREAKMNPDETMQLGVFTIKPAPAKRRHARV